MRYQNVCIETLGYSLPDEIVTSEEIESRLEPLYSRLKLPAGRLELMSGIRQRRFWPAGTLPSEQSILSASRAIEASGIDKEQIGALIHASVCRDYLEPATACSVHRALNLGRECIIYDLSNACLGILNGMLQIADMIELGKIQAGIVVGSEGGRQLVETTIAELNRNASLTRDEVKYAVASLTIGSASAAVLLTHRDLSRTKNSLLGGVVRCDTSANELCRSVHDQAAGEGMQPLMRTDSENLMKAGVALARESFQQFLAEMQWSREEIRKTFCHQVGVAHRKLMFQELGLSPSLDFSTLEWLGNTGAAALPITAALGIEQGHVQPRDRVALLGVGSGLNVIMLGVEWQRTLSLMTASEKQEPAIGRSLKGPSAAGPHEPRGLSTAS